MYKDKNRWRNSGMWVSLVGLVFLVLTNLGVEIPVELQQNVENVVIAVVGLLVALGILNNPTTHNQGFADDKKGEDI